MDVPYHHHIIYIASLVGGVAFALSGVLIGVRKQLDLMGLFILAFITANGGGVVRDVLLSRPLALIRDAEPFLIAGSALLFAAVFRVYKVQCFENRWYFIVCDSIGLVAFALTGALIGLEVHTHCFGVLTLSLLTAVGGSVIRDILVKEMPAVLHSGFYGTVALLQGLAIYGLHRASLMTSASLLCVSAAALALRLIAWRRNWQIPKLC
ncbi:trimeric intracellular cation channel family protein [Megalodesulfovibrio paquesii]